MVDDGGKRIVPLVLRSGHLVTVALPQQSFGGWCDAAAAMLDSALRHGHAALLGCDVRMGAIIADPRRFGNAGAARAILRSPHHRRAQQRAHCSRHAGARPQ
jgi:hypothetical protein